MSTITVAVQDGVARMVLNRPDEANSLNTQMLEELSAELHALHGRDDVFALVLSGEGRGFCAGMDRALAERLLPDGQLGEVQELTRFLDLGGRVFEQIRSFPGITVAAVRGFAIGGGMLLMTACDVRVVVTGARLAVPESTFGLPLSWGAVGGLIDLVGEGRALDWIATGRKPSFEELMMSGFITRAVAEEDLDDVVDEYVTTVRANPALFIRVTKPQIRSYARPASALSTLETLGSIGLLALNDSLR
ncbi:enoyl-CoA hydratase/isomerase family protein [Rhodococcus sp. NPDC127530]|uniref:enoyl-CoA hydratase/isomerase family protein n=1 Tax=unclassified Rhodococcus (in: high G+C Gram-positive bacteria) TaxID=192944 RepID=UPI00363A605B